MATTMPIIVDADTGYGNALSAIRTARGLCTPPAPPGLFLEDQVWPKKCGHFAGKRVVPAEEWLAKLQAVVDLAREGVDLFVVARTDARGAVSLDDAFARARAAVQIGVDAIFVEAPQSIAELEAIAAATPGAMRVANMVEGGRTPLLTPAELHETRLRSCRYAADRADERDARDPGGLCDSRPRGHDARLIATDWSISTEFGWVVETVAPPGARRPVRARDSVDPT